MKILGIETSCDDTGIALLEADEVRSGRFHVLSHIVASQIQVHQQYGGVFPSLAKREHQKNLPIVLKQTLEKQGQDIDMIAVTYGPGLSPCLWTGLNFAKDLAAKHNIPLVPVNHMEGHLLIGLLQQNEHMPASEQIFPAIALIVSGGHTQLLLVKAIGQYELLGETRDDAAGECFDKTARILGLEYPGGPQIAKKAAEYSPKKNKYSIQLPRPMIHTDDYDFSFSGLKTAVLYDFQSRSEDIQKSREYVQEMAHEIQQAVIDVLITKTLRAAELYNAKSIILGGGVSANEELRSQLAKKLENSSMHLFIPAKELCTDNGLMIALAGYFTSQREKIPALDTVEANPNLRIG